MKQAVGKRALVLILFVFTKLIFFGSSSRPSRRLQEWLGPSRPNVALPSISPLAPFSQFGIEGFDWKPPLFSPPPPSAPFPFRPPHPARVIWRDETLESLEEKLREVGWSLPSLLRMKRVNFIDDHLVFHGDEEMIRSLGLDVEALNSWISGGVEAEEANGDMKSTEGFYTAREAAALGIPISRRIRGSSALHHFNEGGIWLPTWGGER